MKTTSDSACDDALATLALGGGDLAAAAHLAGCPACQAERGRAEALARLLAGYEVPAPGP